MEWLIIPRMELLAAQIKLHTTNISIFFLLVLKSDMISANSLQIPTSSLTRYQEVQMLSVSPSVSSQYALKALLKGSKGF